MGVIIRQSIQNTIISYVGIVLGFFITIFLFPRILTADQYGLTRLLFSLALISAEFSHLGVKNVIIRYFPYFKQGRESKQQLLFLAITVPLAGFLIFSVLFLLLRNDFLYYFQDRSALFHQYYLYFFPLMLGILFFDVLNSYYQALHDAVTGSFINEIVVRVIHIALLSIYYYGILDFTEFILLFVLTYTMQPVYLLFTLYRRNELSFAIPFRKGDRRFAGIMTSYGLYSLFGGLSTLLVSNIDIVMLSSLTDLSNTAVYFIAFSVGSVIAVPQRAIFKIAAPVLAGFLKNKNYPEVASLYRRTSLNQLTAGSLIFIGIWANLHNLLSLLPAEYQGAGWVIIIIGFAKLCDMASGINGGIITNSKYYRFGLYIKIFLVCLTILTNYLLIPIYGILGAAIATAFSILIYNLIKFFYVWMKFSMQPFRLNSLLILILAALCLVLSLQIPYLYNFFIDVTVRSLAIAIIFIGTILLFNLCDDVSKLASETIHQTKMFF